MKNTILTLENFIEELEWFTTYSLNKQPWEIVNNLDEIISELLKHLDDNYIIHDNIAIHKNAVIEDGVTLKGAIIISENTRIGAHAYLRGPIFLGKNVTIGPGSEIKKALIFDNSSVAHFNFVGDSIIGKGVNFEAGAICANHFNERKDKNIYIRYNDNLINTNSDKFGALVGDGSKIGANAVLSPGTILKKNSIVKRLELIEQVPELELKNLL